MKTLLKNITLTILAITLFSCNKEDDAPKNNTTTDVYVAGFEDNGLRTVAKIWKNGIGTPLTDGTRTSEALSVFVAQDDIYAAGFVYDGPKSTAKLWKNGTETSLTDGSKNAEANSVCVSGTDVYVAGYESGDAKLW
ncbi:hypothetical protein JBL43_03215 [Aureibaculum sp. A20]|uniref:Bulb-type lectin domain-containing protein n=1 Tax=Aureibaculum flavum TaxID=2795986 RepID=A0ABS0WMQ1_9FLAO|nr:hypothetical protein [Aureibaculum flavum]MBJ2173229.1 hypothetical protein [Aureibaculum flavum]